MSYRRRGEGTVGHPRRVAQEVSFALLRKGHFPVGAGSVMSLSRLQSTHSMNALCCSRPQQQSPTRRRHAPLHVIRTGLSLPHRSHFRCSVGLSLMASRPSAEYPSDSCSILVTYPNRDALRRMIDVGDLVRRAANWRLLDVTAGSARLSYGVFAQVEPAAALAAPCAVAFCKVGQLSSSFTTVVSLPVVAVHAERSTKYARTASGR